MDIFKPSPTISEDTVQFTLHPLPNLSDKLSVTTLAACIWAFVETLLPDFLWHRDPFDLKLEADHDGNDDSWLLEGRMRVGDSVDDEWCIVWILKEISTKWDLVISVSDMDGEFLLIEAAEVLPSWVKPNNSENRVWIYKARLHLIPISHVSPPSRPRRHRKLPGITEDDEGWLNDLDDDSNEYLATLDALNLVRDASVMTFAPQEVEKIVWQRISGYPAAMRNHLHTTTAYIPTDISKSLAVNSALVQKAVEAFYTRDALQLRSAHRMSRFHPHSSILSSVTMTRTAYAQLMGQKFYPPKIFGQWKEREGTDEWTHRDIGMKIAVGFEILYQESKSVPAFNTDDSTAMMQARKDSLDRNSEYIKYLGQLNSAGYFRGEIAGSKLHKASEDSAMNTFIRVREKDNSKRLSFSAQVDTAVATSPEQFAPPAGQEDPDDWLNIDFLNFPAGPEQNTKTSKSRDIIQSSMDLDSGSTEESPEESLAQQQALKMKELASKVERFVEGEGELEGALFDDERFSDLESDESELDSSTSDEDQDQASRKEAMEKLVPGIEPSDYGKMPPLHYQNSQRMAALEMETISAEEAQEDAVSQIVEKPRLKPIRPPIIMRDRYDGVDSDDVTDEEDQNNESDEDNPQVVGDIDIDMEDEEADFLEFSRQALGITDEHWNEIIKDRKNRGAFLPPSAKVVSVDRASLDKPSLLKESSRPSDTQAAVNPNLDSFEAVMQALDAELNRHRRSADKRNPIPTPENKNKEKGKAVVDEDDEDIEAALDAEFKAAVERGDESDEDSEEAPDYHLIRNFLESFKSQGGLSGPVGNLFGRLEPGWRMPRDET